MTEATRITQQELLPLPHWVRVALALRCVRRARRLLRAPTSQLRILDDALNYLERSIRGASADDELAAAAAAAYTLALDNVDGPPAQQSSPTEEDTSLATCMVAHATAFASEAATLADARHAAQLVTQAIDFAIHAHRLADSAGACQVVAAMRTDLNQMAQAAVIHQWSDTTPPPAEFLRI
jgi:hypothetical protein